MIVLVSPLILAAGLALGALGALVLPRPPAGPNHLLVQSGPSDRPPAHRNPEARDYRLFEIEVHGEEAASVDSLDLHGLVRAVLESQQLEPRQEAGAEQPSPEIVPNSVLGVRDVGPGPLETPGARAAAAVAALTGSTSRRFLLAGGEGEHEEPAGEGLYYYEGKDARPKVYVNFRGATGSFRQRVRDTGVTLKYGPAQYLRAPAATESYYRRASPPHPGPGPGKSKAPGKKYDLAASTTTTTTPTTTTTEGAGTLVTSSELPKQIPAPPSRAALQASIAHTTPVHRLPFTATVRRDEAEDERL